MERIKTYFNKKTIIAYISIAFYFIWFYLISSLIGKILSNTLSESFINKHEMALDISMQFIVYIPIFITVILLNKMDIQEDLYEYKNKRDILARKICIGIALMYGITIVANIFASLLDAGESTNQSSLQDMINYNSFTPFILLILIGFLGPIVEEIIYRKSLSTIFKNKYLFMVVSIFLFGIIHVLSTEGTVWVKLVTGIPYFAQGFTFGFLYIKNDKNLIIPIACHIFNNVVAFLMILLIK